MYEMEVFLQYSIQKQKMPSVLGSGRKKEKKIKIDKCMTHQVAGLVKYHKEHLHKCDMLTNFEYIIRVLMHILLEGYRQIISSLLSQT